MLKIVKKMGEFPFSDVCAVYAQSNGELAAQQWPEEPEMQRLYRAEMAFYQYLRHDFFTVEGSFYALWIEGGKVVSAVRFEPWRDGLLLEGLETHPLCRGRGFASMLLAAVLETLSGKVYAHVKKDNGASLRVHEKCGFRRDKDTAMVDGSYSGQFFTLVRD